MSPPFDSVDVVLGSIIVRLEKNEIDINELHSKQRESATKADQLFLHNDDFKSRIRTLENHHQSIFDSHHDVSKKVEMMEAKLDDLRINLTKVVEGQMQILNANATTREEFGSVLASQNKQHTEKMKRLRSVFYIGGGLLFIVSELYARHSGNATIMDSVFKFVTGAQ